MRASKARRRGFLRVPSTTLADRTWGQIVGDDRKCRHYLLDEMTQIATVVLTRMARARRGDSKNLRWRSGMRQLKNVIDHR